MPPTGAVCVVALLLLSACAGPTAVPEGLAATTPATHSPSGSDGDRPKPDLEPSVPPVRRTSDPVTCEDVDTVSVAFSVVDAALGNRYMVLTVRNCSQEPIELPAKPVFEGVEEDGSASPGDWEWREPQGTLILAPDEDKLIVAHWLSNGLCERGVYEMRLHLFDETFSERDCFQFGGGFAPNRDGAAGDLYWADDPSKGPGWQAEA